MKTAAEFREVFRRKAYMTDDVWELLLALEARERREAKLLRAIDNAFGRLLPNDAEVAEIVRLIKGEDAEFIRKSRAEAPKGEA